MEEAEIEEDSTDSGDEASTEEASVLNEFVILSFLVLRRFSASILFHGWREAM